MEIYLPSTVISRIDEINFGKEYNANQIAKIKKILYSLWYYIYYKNMDIEENYYGNIHSADLKKIRLKLNYKDLMHNYFLDLLESANLISINNIYNVGVFSKSYRISNSLNDSYKKIAIKNNLFDDIKTQEYWIKKYPQHQLLIKNYYSVNIDIDAYWEYLWNNENKYLKTKVKYNTALGFPQNVDIHLSADKIYHYINVAMKINLKNFWFKEADSGRLYSTFTSLSSTVHDFLYSNGKRIYEVDIVNCQPLLLASELKNNKKYKEDVQNGVFYENVMAEYGINDRKKIKELLYKYVFFSNTSIASGKMYDTLKKLYPSLLSEINRIVKENNMHLSAILQQKEAKIFLDDIKQCAYERFYITKHDAAFVYEEDIKFMDRCIKEIFMIDFNLSVKTKTNLK